MTRHSDSALIEALRAPPPGLADTARALRETPDPGRISGPDRRGDWRAAGAAPPRIAVATIAFNAADTLGRTFDSIRAQTLRQAAPGAVEYVVVDGGSDDGTLDLLRANEDLLSLWISEKDRGIADAFSKAVALSTAPLTILVNADDWLEPDWLETAVALMAARPEAGFCHGDMVLRDARGAAKCRIAGPGDYAARIWRKMPVNHPSTVVRRDLYARYGLFRPQLRFCMDYDLIWRFAEAGEIGVYAPQVATNMGDAGVSNTGWKALMGEAYALRRSHGVSPWQAGRLRAASTLRVGLRMELERLGLGGLAGALRRRINSDVQSV